MCLGVSPAADVAADEADPQVLLLPADEALVLRQHLRRLAVTTHWTTETTPSLSNPSKYSTINTHMQAVDCDISLSQKVMLFNIDDRNKNTALSPLGKLT